MLGVISVLLWTQATRSLRIRARMETPLNADHGPVVRQSRWGSACINGVGFQSCVRVIE